MTEAPRAPLRVAVLVSGSGTNLQAIIAANQAGKLNIEIAGVISDRPGAFALERARRAGIGGIAVNYTACATRAAFADEIGRHLDGLRPGLVVLAGFMRILPPGLVSRYTGRMLNVHPSLLPKYPGLDTYHRVLEAGDAWHGSTVHFVTPALDAGPAIIQYRVRVRPEDNEGTLRDRVQQGEYIIYPRAIGWLATGRVVLRDSTVFLDGQPLVTPTVVEEDQPPSRSEAL